MDKKLELFTAPTPVCAPVGIVAAALDDEEQMLAVARTDGSLILYRIFRPRRHGNRAPCFFVPAVRTGGHDGCTISRLRFFRGPDGSHALLAATLGGQLLHFAADTLSLLGVVPRAGGALRDLSEVVRCSAEDAPSVFAACGDGAVRRFGAVALERGGWSMQVEQTLPKLADAQRAISVAASAKDDWRVVVFTDDARNVVAYELTADRRARNQLWTLQLPSSVALTTALDAKSATVIVGTSANEVIFIDGRVGVAARVFNHHHGPVTAIAVSPDDGTVYASGWHELLRAYRRGDGSRDCDASSYTPAETKRRTHYHECAALLCTRSRATDGPGMFFSLSRDGTLMHCDQERLFSDPAQYFDASHGAQDFQRGLLVSASRSALQFHRVLPTRVHAMAAFETREPHPVRGLWLSPNADHICVAWDARVAIYTLSVDWAKNELQKISRVFESGAGKHAVHAPECNGAAFAASASGREVCFVASQGNVLTVGLKNREATAGARRKRSADVAAAVSTFSLGAVVLTSIHVLVNRAAQRTTLFAAYCDPAPKLAMVHVHPDTLELHGVTHTIPTSTWCMVPRVLTSDAADEIVFWSPPHDGFHTVTAPAKASEVTRAPMFLTRAAAVFPNANPLLHHADGAFVGCAPQGVIAFTRGGRFTMLHKEERETGHSVLSRIDAAAVVPTRLRDTVNAQASDAASQFLRGAIGGALAAAETDVMEGAIAAAHEAAAVQAAVESDESVDASMVILQRNIDGCLMELPQMWRVRRFGN